ncbi:MAG: isoamylase early set domain-containing protein [Chloroflexi bacterium]|nr:isoamylase early set domain-containing protein [Chloroflexota bacterium]
MLRKKFFKTNDDCEVTFEYAAPEATEVALLCDAQNWEPTAMKKTKEGSFRTKIRLAKGGQYQFRYLVDGESWANDEAADAYWANEHGGDNSVVFTSEN